MKKQNSNFQPLWLLFLLGMLTAGFYNLVWIIKTRLQIRKLTGADLPIWVLFIPIYNLLIVDEVFSKDPELLRNKTNIKKKLKHSHLYVIVFLVLGFLGGREFVPLSITWLIISIQVLIVSHIQYYLNLYWNAAQKVKKQRTLPNAWEWIIISVLSIFWLLAGIGWVSEIVETNESEFLSEKSPVVNILCPTDQFDVGGSRGSGTIIDSKGTIVTNAHVIPQDKNEELITVDEGCYVVLPNLKTGKPEEIYLAKPEIISNDLDLATLEIYDVYESDEGENYGEYPKEFPTISCENHDVQLGDKVRVVGYPSMSGGYNLTITEGIVSSFISKGLITTSAKIDQGNSGGLAIDEEGCMIGIPMGVKQGEYDTLGVIISLELFDEILKEESEIEEEEEVDMEGIIDSLLSPKATLDNLNLPDGEHEVYYDNGQMSGKYNVLNNKADGKGTLWYENGQKEAEANYKEGKMHGSFTTWHDNGQLEAEGEMKNGVWVGNVVAYHRNGNKEKEGVNDENGNEIGVWTIWHENGEKSYFGDYGINGKAEGFLTAFYENGEKQTESFYENGLKEGKSLAWHEDGTNFTETNYLKGKRHGKFIMWQEDGESELLEGNFVNGELGSGWYVWDDEGNRLEMTKEEKEMIMEKLSQ